MGRFGELMSLISDMQEVKSCCLRMYSKAFLTTWIYRKPIIYHIVQVQSWKSVKGSKVKTNRSIERKNKPMPPYESGRMFYRDYAWLSSSFHWSV